MKKLILLMMAIGFWSSLFAQNIVEGEYFFDNKVDYGLGTPIVINNPGNSITVDLNLNDSIDILLDGLHRLFFRFKDSNGLWSHTFSRPIFVKHHQVINIVEGEYFFDEKVDYGDGIPMDVNNQASITFSDIDLDTTMIDLSDGLHRMFFRFKDNTGLWSHTFSRPVWVKHHEVITIVAGEYFIDDMVGYGEGYPIDVDNVSNIIQVIDTILAYGNLTAGEHDLFFRFKDSNGLWSHTCKKTVCTGVVTGTYSADNSSYCQGDTIMFNYSSTETSEATYSWDLDCDGNYDLQTNGEPFSYPLPGDFNGTYSIKLNAQSPSCLSSFEFKDTFTFEVHPTYNIPQDVIVCSGNSYTFPDGSVMNDITSPVIDTSFLQTVIHSCDSIFITTINPYQIDTSIVETGNTLMANTAGVGYQWLDCGNGYSIISGETNQSFMPTTTGSYGVEISDNGCTDTSECHQVIIVGTNEINSDYEITVYPNPFMDQLQIYCDCSIDAKFIIYDQLGRLVKSDEINLNGSIEISTENIENGLYFIVIQDIENNELLIQKTIVKIE